MNAPQIRRLAGLLLIVVPVAFTTCFTLLQMQFEYPDILRQSTADVLAKFQAGGTRLIAVWYALTLTAVLFIPVVMLMHRVLAAQEVTVTLWIATVFGVVGWGLAFLGFPLGGLAASALVGSITTPLEGVIGGAATGAVIGLAQWLVLRRRLALPPWWIAATAAGMGAGLALGIALLGTDTAGIILPLRGLVTGAGIGIAQLALLRGITGRALVWPLVVACGWAIGWLVTRAAGIDLAADWSVFGAAGALTLQLLTGLALAWLLPPADLSGGQ